MHVRRLHSLRNPPMLGFKCVPLDLYADRSMRLSVTEFPMHDLCKTVISATVKPHSVYVKLTPWSHMILCGVYSWHHDVSSWFPWRSQWNVIRGKRGREESEARADDTRMPAESDRTEWDPQQFIFNLHIGMLLHVYLLCASVKPGVKYREIGDVIQRHAQVNGFSVVRTYCGHGIHR